MANIQPDKNTREDNIYFARLSEQGERYEDMILYMKAVAQVSRSHLCLVDLIGICI